MANKKLVTTLNKILEKGWLFLFLLSPIFFTVFFKGTWQVSEALFFQIIVEILFALWIIKIIISQKFSFKPKLKLLLPVLGFFIALGFSSIFSKYSFNSFWGSYSRKMGYFFYIHLFLFFVILFFNLKKTKQVMSIAKTIVLSSLVVSFYGFLQFLDLDPLTWAESPAVLKTGRVFSTLGQPNFLASWLLLALPIIVWLVIKKGYFHSFKTGFKTIFIRPLLLTLFLLSVLVLLFTQSRGGWIGFIIGFFFFTIILSFIIGEKRLGVLLIILFLVLVIFLTYINLHPFNLEKGPQSDLIYRFKTLSHLLEKGELRLMWWQDSFKLIKEKPAFGFGLDTQRFEFVNFYNPRVAVLEAINSYPDRIHNDILDTIYTSGFVGLGFYVLMIVLAFYKGFKYIKEVDDKKKKILSLSLMSGILGYLVSLQFSFHVIPTAVYFFGYLALIIILPSLNNKKA